MYWYFYKLKMNKDQAAIKKNVVFSKYVKSQK